MFSRMSLLESLVNSQFRAKVAYKEPSVREILDCLYYRIPQVK